MGLSKDDKYFIEKLGELLLRIPEDAKVPENITEYFIDKMKEMGLEIPEYTVGLGVEKHFLERFKEMGLKIPEGVSLPKIDMSTTQEYFWGLNFRIDDETERYLNSFDINIFGCKQDLTDEEKVRWLNIYKLSKRYNLDTLINSFDTYRKDKKENSLTLPISGSDIMDGNGVDFFHHKHLKKYFDKYWGISGDILAIFFRPEHKILTRQSSNELKYYVYIHPSRFSAEIILSYDYGKIQVLSKEKISNEILEKYLLYSEKNVLQVIGEKTIDNYLNEENGT
jgi:hypothetical protein